MYLHEYRWLKRTSYAQLAKEFECSRSYLNQVALKKIKPSKFFANLVEAKTEGLVTAKEVLNPKFE